jgi:hypothetical protein
MILKLNRIAGIVHMIESRWQEPADGPPATVPRPYAR